VVLAGAVMPNRTSLPRRPTTLTITSSPILISSVHCLDNTNMDESFIALLASGLSLYCSGLPA
jgi:hypothetical protein